MSSKDIHERETELESALERLRRWAFVFTSIVVIGLFIELRPPVLAFSESGDLRDFVESIGGILVALGVAGELFVIWRENRRERNLRDVRAELDRQSAERIANSEKATAEAKLEAERLKAEFAWRVLRPELMGNLIAKLRAETGSVWIEYINGDVESQQLARQFFMVFRSAKWHVGIRSCTGSLLLFGIFVRAPEGEPRTDSFIEQVLVACGVECVGFDFPQWASTMSTITPVPEPSARLFIGPKQHFMSGHGRLDEPPAMK
jgi:hypothetical protein